MSDSVSDVLTWATQFFCNRDDHDIVKDIMTLRKCELADRDTADVLSDTQPLARSRIPGPPCPRQPQPTVPWFLGIGRVASQYTAALGIAAALAAGWLNRSSLRCSLTCVRSLKSRIQPDHRGLPHYRSPSTQPADVPALIYSLITIENARRRLAQEWLKQSKGEQSERLLHHIVKRNAQAEAKFESILVALKELVVLRAIRDPDTTQIGELKQGLGRISSKAAPDVAQRHVSGLIWPMHC
ncbi:hypothetical protein DL89DRAFT_258552 [Linderina pennispora]|uniref:Uncharacterized protein n=1 Tax=Linderina pennispora TaxID=61395 RepID=A0A1Y1W5S8_9FUNG|nr:uncharacterized protein DL89DRAFT_258552 [Linderina pennispora]ORX68705.1 hypothetical protein DL89DRAFT_258552 [Linderina pennispora]